MAGTIVVDRLESDASYASSINIASPIQFSNTITGNVNIDSGTLFVDSVGNRVGIGTASPTSDGVLDVVGSGTTFARLRSSAGSAVALFFQNSDTGTTSGDGFYVGVDSAEKGLIWNTENTDLRIATNNTERINIDASGRVTTPSQPSAALGRNADFTTIASTILWDVVHHNVGNHYNSSTGLFTCPVAGYYLVSIMVMSNGTNQTMDIELRLNGSTNNQLVPYQALTGGDYNQVSGMTVISCAANDTLGFRLNNGSIYGGGSTGRHGAVVFRLLG